MARLIGIDINRKTKREYLLVDPLLDPQCDLDPGLLRDDHILHIDEGNK
jgi:hypothetical protein